VRGQRCDADVAQEKKRTRALLQQRQPPVQLLGVTSPPLLLRSRSGCGISNVARAGRKIHLPQAMENQNSMAKKDQRVMMAVER
jgi:hypothetical protein